MKTLLLVIFLISSLLLIPVLIDGQYMGKFPPTAAFRNITDGTTNITAAGYADLLTFTEGTNMTLTFFPNNNTIRFASAGGGSGGINDLHNIGNVTDTGCVQNEILAVNSSGFWVCSTAGGSFDAETVTTFSYMMYQVGTTSTWNVINGSTGAIDFTGTTESALLQSAIDSLIDTGGLIFIKVPHGLFDVDGGIQIPNSNIAIVTENILATGLGAPNNAVVFWSNDVGVTYLNVTGDDNYFGNLHFSRAATGQTAILIQDSQRNTFETVNIQNAFDIGLHLRGEVGLTSANEFQKLWISGSNIGILFNANSAVMGDSISATVNHFNNVLVTGFDDVGVWIQNKADNNSFDYLQVTSPDTGDTCLRIGQGSGNSVGVSGTYIGKFICGGLDANEPSIEVFQDTGQTKHYPVIIGSYIMDANIDAIPFLLHPGAHGPVIFSTINDAQDIRGGRMEILAISGILETPPDITIQGYNGTLKIPTNGTTGGATDANFGNIDGAIGIKTDSDSLWFRSSGTWINASAGGGGGGADNLGDHTAIQDLNMSDFDILRVDDIELWQGQSRIWFDDDRNSFLQATGDNVIILWTNNLAAMRWDGSNIKSLNRVFTVDHDNPAVAATFRMESDRAAPLDGNRIGRFEAYGTTDTLAQVSFGNVLFYAEDIDNTNRAGGIAFRVTENNTLGTTTDYLRMNPSDNRVVEIANQHDFVISDSARIQFDGKVGALGEIDNQTTIREATDGNLVIGLGGGDEYNFNATHFDLLGNTLAMSGDGITGLVYLEFDVTGQKTIFNATDGIDFDLSSGERWRYGINGITEYTFNGTHFDLMGNTCVGCGGGGGDNLGDHIATQDLNMSNFSIIFDTTGDGIMNFSVLGDSHIRYIIEDESVFEIWQQDKNLFPKGLVFINKFGNDPSMYSNSTDRTLSLLGNLQAQGAIYITSGQSLCWGHTPADCLAYSYVDHSAGGTTVVQNVPTGDQHILDVNDVHEYSFNATNFEIFNNQISGNMTATDGQILQYNATTDVWEAETAAGGGGSNVKSGVIASLADDASTTVTFGTAFSGTPNVVATLGTNQLNDDVVQVYSISTTGFTVQINKVHGGGGHTWAVQWIATDAGDP